MSLFLNRYRATRYSRWMIRASQFCGALLLGLILNIHRSFENQIDDSIYLCIFKWAKYLSYLIPCSRLFRLFCNLESSQQTVNTNQSDVPCIARSPYLRFKCTGILPPYYNQNRCIGLSSALRDQLIAI